ncbi:unnamed protein product [Ceutorhynchus assimilis]|uniref:INTS8 TPR repeats domain-containing protein n=1 Tax=Ceutorhynchus assimilis TaxID=467358 RepID=A0A9N9MK51_9CUCU|nr:unnamed protein product [Ceutorhynchus assimilis]
MDVDLLKPGTVPISPDTVLMFEFLLDKNLLWNHLRKPNPDPAPIDLITKFYDAIARTLRNQQEPENSESTNLECSYVVQHPAKNIAMKIMSLKVAAYLNWKLTEIRSLPFKTQISLLQDLMYFTSEKKTIMEISNIEEPDIKTASPQFLFALLLFHRWLLSTSMHRITSNWQQRYGPNEMSPIDENIICCPDNIKKTVTFLTDALEWEEIPFMLTFDCFKMLTEENASIEFDWSKGQPISSEEFRAQICYDLGTFFFYQENYEVAKQHFSQCQNFCHSITSQNGFAVFDKKVLNVYVSACDPTLNVPKKSLSEQLNNSIVNHFMGITNILQQDNLRKEIPLGHRINLELDIQGALSSGVFTVARDLLYKVKALNYVRCILDKKLLNEYSVASDKNVDTFFWAIQINWKFHEESDKKTIKNYIFALIVKDQSPTIMERIKANECLKNMFDTVEWMYLTKKVAVFDAPESVCKPKAPIFDPVKKRKPKRELKHYSRLLIITYDWKEIKDLLTKIRLINAHDDVWDINPLWELPTLLLNVIKALPKESLRDLAYVLLAKSKKQLLNKDWNSALELLIILGKELQSATCNVTKLSKMLNWEVLLIQITQLMENWPQSNVDKLALVNACEGCLQTSDSVLPRSEILESCAICILNLGRWEFLINHDKRMANLDIISAIALACNEIVKNKGAKKFSRNLWDLVLPVFAPNPSGAKRGAGYHDNSSHLKNNLLSIFLRLKDSLCLTVTISILSKLYNIFKDDNNLELQVDYMNLWPATVSNANSYIVEAASEMLFELLNEALKIYPTNIPWLRLKGDLNFANNFYKKSLSFYLKSLMICYDNFNIPIRYDEHIFRRMIKCCQALNCFTQAAVLCQFLEEPDYALAFRILGEQKACNDAMDAYYHCFWDTNILEFLIYSHNRRGEFQRKKFAIQVMGMLEINSNNNEEIQREASNLRKSIFLRDLCKQYVF